MAKYLYPFLFFQHYIYKHCPSSVSGNKEKLNINTIYLLTQILGGEENLNENKYGFESGIIANLNQIGHGV